MPEYLEFTIDKFTFRIADDRLYSVQGIWAKLEVDGRVRLGVSDFVQGHNGDVAFVELEPLETQLDQGDSFSSLETIKVDIDLPTPLSGEIVAVNPLLDDAPEMVNQDPYGEGWLVLLAPRAWETERVDLMSARAYFEQAQAQAQEEL